MHPPLANPVRGIDPRYNNHDWNAFSHRLRAFVLHILREREKFGNYEKRVLFTDISHCCSSRDMEMMYSFQSNTIKFGNLTHGISSIILYGVRVKWTNIDFISNIN